MKDAEKRAALVCALGLGIDERGRHAAGFVNVDPQGHVKFARVLGKWGDASNRFLRAAASGETTLLHARYATLNNAGRVDCAHPFAIQRPDLDGKVRTVLWGCHNGVSYDAEDSAYAHGRGKAFTVDSREIFELLADEKRDAINALNGWGVLAWIRGDDRQRIRICMLDSHADMYVVKTECGGIVFGSTKEIVTFALELAKMTQACSYRLAPGKTYYAEGGEFYVTREPEMTFSSRWGGWGDTADYAGYADYLRGSTITRTRYDRETGEARKETLGWDWDRGEYVTTDVDDATRAAWDRAAHDVDRYLEDADVVADTEEEKSAEELIAEFETESDAWDQKDWWRHVNDNDFDRAALLRAIAKDKR